MTNYYHFHDGAATWRPSESRRGDKRGEEQTPGTVREKVTSQVSISEVRRPQVGKQGSILTRVFFPANYLKGHIAISIRMFLTTQVSVKSKSSAMNETRVFFSFSFLFFFFFLTAG